MTAREKFEKEWKRLNWFSRIALSGPDKEQYWSWFEAGWNARDEPLAEPAPAVTSEKNSKEDTYD